MWGIFLLAFFIIVSSEKPKEFSNSKDVVFFTRAEEVIIFGLFRDLKSKQAKSFKRVAKQYNAGFKFGIATDESIWKRFDDIIDVEKQEAMLILRNFREDGEKRKRGKDKIVFEGKFTKKKLKAFINAQAIPPVISFPDATKHGVDESNRFEYAQGLNKAKLFCFRKESAHSPLLGKVGQNLGGRVQILDIDATHPDSKSFVTSFNPQYDTNDFAAVFAPKDGRHLIYEGVLEEEELTSWLQKLLPAKKKGKTEL